MQRSRFLKCRISSSLLVVLAFASLNNCSAQNSHIEANIPPQEIFQETLERDCLSHLLGLGYRGDRIEVELLRTGPTQSGMSFPKYYVWIALRKSDAVVTTGAARLAAVNGQRFEVTEYMPAEQVRENPTRLSAVFPAALVEYIRARSRKDSR
jgi:hypothetical protein